MTTPSINYNASAVNLDGLRPEEVRQMNSEIRAFMDNLFSRYGLHVESESNNVETGIRVQ